MLDKLAEELHAENVALPEETDEVPAFGKTSDPVKEFQKLWETAAEQFAEQSKSLDELSARLDSSKRQTVPETLRQLQILMMEAIILTRTLHKKLEQKCEKTTQ